MRAWTKISVSYNLENTFFTKNGQHMVSILGNFEPVHDFQKKKKKKKKKWPKDFL